MRRAQGLRETGSPCRGTGAQQGHSGEGRRLIRSLVLLNADAMAEDVDMTTARENDA